MADKKWIDGLPTEPCICWLRSIWNRNPIPSEWCSPYLYMYNPLSPAPPQANQVWQHSVVLKLEEAPDG